MQFLSQPSPAPLSSVTKPKPIFSAGTLALLAAILLGFNSLAFSATVQVGHCTNLASYATINEAVNSVPSGSTIKICPGTYAEQVLINQSLTLTGVASNGLTAANAAGGNNPTITATNSLTANATDLADGSPIAAQIAVVTPPTAGTAIIVNISNITVDGSSNQISGCSPDPVGIYYQNASGTVNHVTARFQEFGPGLGGCQGGLAIFAESGYTTNGTSVITIENSSVHDYDKNGITVDGSGTTATVMGNYVVGAGATTVTAQNGIQVSDGANGKVSNNTVTDNVYTSPAGGPYYSASGILLYDSGGNTNKVMTVSGNTVSDSQGGIVVVGDSNGTADYNSITSNKITTSPAAGPYFIDGIDLCSNHNTATSNTVFNSSGSGIHIDSECTEMSGTSGNTTTVNTNTINEACAGVLTGSPTSTGNSETGNITYNVGQTTQSGDSCPASPGAKAKIRLRPLPFRRQ